MALTPTAFVPITIDEIQAEARSFGLSRDQIYIDRINALLAVVAGNEAIPASAKSAGSPVIGSVALNPPKINGQLLMPNPSNRVVGLGDSLTTPSGSTTQAAPYTGVQAYRNSYLAMGCALLQGQLILSGLFGGSGYTSTQCLNLNLPLVLAMNPLPGYCIICIGTNEVGLANPMPLWEANVLSMCRQLRAAGVEPILALLPPRNDATILQVRQFNLYISRFASRNGIQLIDTFSAVVDPVTGQYKTGFNIDNVHPSAKGAWAMAQGFRLLQLPPWTPPYLTQDAADTMNLLANGVFAGAGPTPTSWTHNVGAGATPSLIAGDPSIAGQWLQITDTQNSVDSMSQQINTGSGFAVGDTLALSLLASANGTAGGGNPIMEIVCSGTAVAFYPMDGTITVSTGGWQADFSRVLTYFEFVVPPGTTSLVVYFGIEGGPGTVRYAQATLVNLTTQAGTPGFVGIPVI